MEQPISHHPAMTCTLSDLVRAAHLHLTKPWSSRRGFSSSLSPSIPTACDHSNRSRGHIFGCHKCPLWGKGGPSSQNHSMSALPPESGHSSTWDGGEGFMSTRPKWGSVRD